MAKKAWMSICDRDYRSPPNTEQIIWDSSSSDEDAANSPVWKKPKPIQFNCSNRFPVISVSVQCNSKSSESTSSLDSPVIRLRCVDLNHISPEIPTQRKQDLSPVIEKHRFKTVQKKKQHIRQKLFKNYDQNSVTRGSSVTTCLKSNGNTTSSSVVTSSLFSYSDKSGQYTKLSQNIECTPPHLIPVNSQAEIKIEPFESQFGTVVEDTDSRTEKWGMGLNFEPKKRRKKYKKGTLAHQLYKTLQLKKSRTKIWKHERQKEEQINWTTEVIKFKCILQWNEYGVKLLECEKDGSRKFVICLGVSQILEISYELGLYYELYPPYEIGQVFHGGENLPYYYNVSKIAQI